MKRLDLIIVAIIQCLILLIASSFLCLPRVAFPLGMMLM